MDNYYQTIHLTESATRLGGIETLITGWIEADSQSAAVCILDKPLPDPSKSRIFGLRNGRWHPLYSIRSQARALRLKCDTLICHNFCGIHSLSDLIDYQKLVVYMHTNSNDVWLALKNSAPHIHFILAGSVSLKDQIMERFPNFKNDVASLDCPISLAFFEDLKKMPSASLKIGYAGRLSCEQKQVGRLESFCSALKKQTLPFHLFIAGSGPERENLKHLLAPYEVDFLGPVPHIKMPELFASWDFQIFTSDYETGPISALEGTACGAIPIFPDIPCQLNQLLGERFPQLFYPVGQMEKAAECLRKISHFSDENLQSLRINLKSSLTNHSWDHFLDRVKQLIQAKVNSKRLRKRTSKSWKDLLPMFILCRLESQDTFLK